MTWDARSTEEEYDDRYDEDEEAARIEAWEDAGEPDDAA